MKRRKGNTPDTRMIEMQEHRTRGLRRLHEVVERNKVWDQIKAPANPWDARKLRIL